MAITAAQVKELRERTGAGMMECKKALTETAGDMDAAIDHLRKAGAAKADKKAGRVAAEGRIFMAADGNTAVLAEINSETDFVAIKAEFVEFGQAVADAALAAGSEDISSLQLDGVSVDERRRDMVATIGENITARRAAIVTAAGTLGSYIHSNNRIGVLVALEGGDEELAKGLAMHIAASNPAYLDDSAVPEDVLEKEREVIRAQSEGSGKPAEIIEKMVEGRLRKYLGEITLLGQPYALDPDTTVGKLLKAAGATVSEFVRMEVGEGIEKEESDFAAEVKAQAEAAQNG